MSDLLLMQKYGDIEEQCH